MSNASHRLAEDDPTACEAFARYRDHGDGPPRGQLSHLRRCGRLATVRTPEGHVCRQHHRFGFMSWTRTVGTAAPAPEFDMAERMRAVVGE